MTRLLCAAAFLCALALPGSGYTHHVYYDDSIQEGIDSVSPGDTVLVHPGTYYEDITLAHRVNVWSTNGSGSTKIDGGSADQTVDSNGADSLRFGGPVAGFTIDGGVHYGVWLSGSNAVHVEDLVLVSDPDEAGMAIISCAATTDLEDITIGPIADPLFGGLYVSSFHGNLEDITVHKTGSTGVWVEGCSPDFTDLQVDTCTTGLLAWDGYPSVEGSNSEIKDCTHGAVASAYSWSASLTLDGVDFLRCTTGAGAGAYYPRVTSVALTDCSFDGCGDGIIVNRCQGSITGCTFTDLAEDGITITENVGTITLGGNSAQDVNSFDGVDGIGIYVSTGADADIDSCYFSDVEETAIHVNSGCGGTTIDGVEMDGAGDCFEGIYTRGSSTFAEVRDCRMYDYQAAVSPPTPRGACAGGATADLGTREDHGNNDLHSNSIDLQYINRDANPDSLYAVGNWWGESPPDANTFAGRTDYIVYIPYRTTQPKLMPVTEPEELMPDVAKLVSIHPSPSRGDVTFRYALPEAGRVTLEVLDLSGRLIATVEEGARPAGFTSVVWNGRTSGETVAASGVYLCRMATSATSETFRFVLVR